MAGILREPRRACGTFELRLLGVTVAAVLTGGTLSAADLPYRSPFDVAFSPDGALIAVSDRTAGELVLVRAAAGEIAGRIELRGQPTGVAWAPGGGRVFVAEYDAGSVAEIDAETAKVLRRHPAGLRPMGVAVAPGGKSLLVANTVTDDVTIVDLEGGGERARIKVPREPFFVATTPDGSLGLAANLLPLGSATRPDLAAVVSLIDLETPRNVGDVPLSPGSTNVREIVVSPDGRWAYVVHTVGRFHVPATQLDRGWINTNALSIIDIEKRERYVTMLLDRIFEGAADPWGLAVSPDAETLWISLRGVHQLVRLSLAPLHRLLAGESPTAGGDKQSLTSVSGSVWNAIREDPEQRAVLADDLSALHVAGVIERFDLPGNGPRGLDLSPDGQRLAVALYYSGGVAVADATNGRVIRTVSLGSRREPDAARRGEMLFHDGDLCFQKWLSCATCHPDNARTDGLRWDLLNDGIGTPQRTRSLLWSHRFRPTTTRGVRPGIEVSVPKGMLFLMHQPEPEIVEALLAYLRSLEPEPSPYLVDGELSAAAKRGREIFEGKARCAPCHPGELGADMKAHDVGTRGEYDRPDDVFYTPKLVELYRTAPFLHDARAAALEEVFTRHDPEGKHGHTADLDREELNDLIEYLLSR